MNSIVEKAERLVHVSSEQSIYAVLRSGSRSAGGADRIGLTMASVQRFGFEFDARYDRVARRFGISPTNAWVDVGNGLLQARDGRSQLCAELSNVKAGAITGPYRFLKTVRPGRLDVTDLRLTFASNGGRGVLISFRRRVPESSRSACCATWS